ncbi:hypothetical protein [Candidatus Cardinium hertigii]|nr:hypothetical protein [Candidatus Cardinium hertigii]
MGRGVRNYNHGKRGKEVTTMGRGVRNYNHGKRGKKLQPWEEG